MIRYSICDYDYENDVGPKDPNHPRIILDVRDLSEFGDECHDARLIVCADGVPTDADLCHTEEEAERVIRRYWAHRGWGLRKE